MKIKQDKSTYFISPVWSALAALGAILCGSLFYYHYTTSDKNKKTQARLATSLKTHDGNIGKLSRDYSDLKAQQTREKTAMIKAAMKSTDEIDHFVASLRPAWSIVSKSEDSNEEYIRRRYQIARGSVPASAWPEFLGLISQMKHMYSLAVNDVEILTVGDNKKREFSRVSLSFVVYVRKPEKTK